MAKERVNQMLASEMVTMQAMVAGVMGGGDSARRFKKLIDRLQG